MAIESAFAANGLGVNQNVGLRRDDISPAVNTQRPDALASAQPASSDVAVQVTAPDMGPASVLDRVSGTQQARDALNQVQDTLVQQQQVVANAADAPDEQQADLEGRQAELQSARTEILDNAPGLNQADSPVGNLAETLREQNLVGSADELPDAAQLGAGIEQVGAAQDALTDAEIALTAEFNAAQDARLQGPAGAVTNPSEAESLLNRVLANESELVRTSNAVDDNQRQQTLNLLTI